MLNSATEYFVENPKDIQVSNDLDVFRYLLHGNVLTSLRHLGPAQVRIQVRVEARLVAEHEFTHCIGPRITVAGREFDRVHLSRN